MEETKRTFTEVKYTVPWGHIAGKLYGAPAQTRVLMVHGRLDNAGSFNRLLEFLPREYQYICVDLPGHGYSTPFPAGLPLNFFNYVYSIKLVLKYLAWDTCIFIGHSFGVQLGVYFSIMYPGTFTKIVALDGLLNNSIDLEELLPLVVDYYDIDKYARDSERTYTKEEILHALQFRRNSVLNSAAAEALFERAVVKVGDKYRYSRDPRMRKNILAFTTVEHDLLILAKLCTPTLLIMQDSPYRPMFISFLQQRQKSLGSLGSLKIVPLSGNHDNHNNDPESVAPHICAFLRDNLTSKL